MMIKSFLMEFLPIVSGVIGLAVLLGFWAFRLSCRCRGTSPPLSHRWEKGVDELGVDAADLMGKAVLEEGVSVVSAEEFSFAGVAVDQADEKTERLGLIADVHPEIKSVCALLAQKDGSKEDFFSMFEFIRTKYPKMAGHPSLSELRPFIRERVPFHLSDEELDRLWS